MVRLYGNAPYKIVLAHGGPGAIGSLKGFAQELNALSQIGVVEAIQSKYSIAELIEENEQLIEYYRKMDWNILRDDMCLLFKMNILSILQDRKFIYRYLRKRNNY